MLSHAATGFIPQAKADGLGVPEARSTHHTPSRTTRAAVGGSSVTCVRKILASCENRAKGLRSWRHSEVQRRTAKGARLTRYPSHPSSSCAYPLTMKRNACQLSG